MRHEEFVAAVAAVACERVSQDERDKLTAIKLVYGAGPGGARGVTYFGRWRGKGSEEPAPFVEVCALGQEHFWQVAGTTLHELGHVLAGPQGAHKKAWREACARIGLRRAKAAGMAYLPANFAPDVRDAILALGRPDEGEPVPGIGLGLVHGVPTRALRPCTFGVGSRGGHSRGKGSGSRYRLWRCECTPPVKVRAATGELRAHCDACARAFVKA